MTRPAETRSRTLTQPHDFVAAGLVAPAEAEALARVSARYSAAVTGHLAALVDATDPADPIARQFVPDPRELETTPQERADPIGDDAHAPSEGLVHRYPDRVRDKSSWEKAMTFARDVMQGKAFLNTVNDSTHYHADYVHPRWVRGMVKRDKIGRHIFYQVRKWI